MDFRVIYGALEFNTPSKFYKSIHPKKEKDIKKKGSKSNQLIN